LKKKSKKEKTIAEQLKSVLEILVPLFRYFFSVRYGFGNPLKSGTADRNRRFPPLLRGGFAVLCSCSGEVYKHVKNKQDLGQRIYIVRILGSGRDDVKWAHGD
jgi:hypothetical protein